MNRKARCPGSRFAYVPRASGDDSGPLFVWFLPRPARGGLFCHEDFCPFADFCGCPGPGGLCPTPGNKTGPRDAAPLPSKGGHNGGNCERRQPLRRRSGLRRAHPNGGGFVAKTASVAKTAFVGLKQRFVTRRGFSAMPGFMGWHISPGGRRFSGMLKSAETPL